ncbi:MAG: 50S ribosome-binding GTPase [Actinomycetaceae bacterium]|nr:50S ribosome-binding GTPase [Actinomycetaceae bacterium]
MNPKERVDVLAEVMTLLGDDASANLQDGVADVLYRCENRNLLGLGQVVIALVGATGSGKSSLFNALVGADLAHVDVLRPTTRKALAALRDEEAASEILNWVGVDSRVIPPNPDVLPEGLIVLDLPDIDSRSMDNRELTRKLAQRVDLIVWVLDPQKYADNVIHSQWIAPLVDAARATRVVLSQVDLLPEMVRGEIAADLQSKLERDGVRGVPIHLVSSKTGEGVADLREAIAHHAEQVRAEHLRLQGELDHACSMVAGELGLSPETGTLKEKELTDALVGVVAQGAGVEAIAADTGRAYMHRHRLAAGWLPLRWIAALRSDPLVRRHLGGGGSGSAAGAGQSVSSVETMGTTALAQVSTGIRRSVDSAVRGRPDIWVRKMREIARRGAGDVPDKTDLAIARTDLNMGRAPGWWLASNLLQILAWLVALVGGGWLAARLAAQAYLLLELPVFPVNGLPLPTWLLLGGLAAGVVIACISWVCARAGAGRRKRLAAKRLRDAVRAAVTETVVAPLMEEEKRQGRVIELMSSMRRK